jgi:hypothetical protein
LNKLGEHQVTGFALLNTEAVEGRSGTVQKAGALQHVQNQVVPVTACASHHHVFCCTFATAAAFCVNTAAHASKPRSQNTRTLAGMALGWDGEHAQHLILTARNATTDTLGIRPSDS